MQPRILFIYLSPTSFVRDDLEMLGKEVELVPFHFDIDKARSPIGMLGLLLKQARWLFRELKKADVVLGWFADYHMVLPTFFAKWYQKPLALSLGGYECIHLPELEYGVYESSWRAPMARFVLRRASLLLPVAAALMCSENHFSEFPTKRKFGLCAHIPEAELPHQVLPTGYVPDRWKLGPADRSAIVSTVALLSSHRTVRRKGVDLVIASARLRPAVTFRIIGVDPNFEAELRSRYKPPENVELFERLPRESLEALYQESDVYIQLSRAEGMPNVLCEAMLCGCIPVASDVFGNAAALGNNGVLVATPQPEHIVEAIDQALGSSGELRKACRQHIMNSFQREHRRQGFLKAFKRLTEPQ